MKRPPPSTYLYIAMVFAYFGASSLAIVCMVLHLTDGRPFGPRLSKLKPKRRKKMTTSRRRLR